MPNINYYAREFPPTLSSNLHGAHSLTVSWHEIVWAAVSVGKRGFDDMLTHGSHSLDEILFRAYIIWANLWVKNGFIERSPVYDDLDPTEKGSISYFLGMAVAKLFAWRLFSSPWMVHLDRLVNTHAVGLSGRSRPDLAGQDFAGRWILIEAKGRTGAFSQAAMDQAKTQVCQVRDIDGSSPHLRVGMQMYFAPTLRMELVDPEEPRRDSVSLDIGAQRLGATYYKRLNALRVDGQRTLSISGENFRFIDYNSIGVSVGIADAVEKLTGLDSLEPVLSFGGEDENVFEEAEGGRRYRAFADGVAIGLDDRWSQSSMETKPLER